MNKNKYKYSGGKLTRSIFTRFFLSLAIYSFALVVSVIFASIFLSYFTWDSGDFLYRILNFIRNNELFFLACFWLFGFIVIFLIYWRKTLGYVDTIVEASNMLVEPGDDFIHLPDELKQVEDRMNQIKQQAIRNARLAKESEQRKNDLIVYLAHDLKTPLTSVIGYLTLLRDELQISEELREKYLSISLQKAERLEDLI